MSELTGPANNVDQNRIIPFKHDPALEQATQAFQEDRTGLAGFRAVYNSGVFVEPEVSDYRSGVPATVIDGMFADPNNSPELRKATGAAIGFTLVSRDVALFGTKSNRISLVSCYGPETSNGTTPVVSTWEIVERRRHRRFLGFIGIGPRATADLEIHGWRGVPGSRQQAA